MSFVYNKGKSSLEVSNKRQKLVESIQPDISDKLNTIVLLSWNVDGLNNYKDIERSIAITKKINELNKKPNLIHLQEITPSTVSTYLKELGALNYIVSDQNLDLRSLPHYFTLSFYHYPTIKLVNYIRKDFSNSKSLMGRSMEISTIEIVSSNSLVNLMNLHLESTGAINTQFSIIRQAQLKEALQFLITNNNIIPSIVSGDLNIRQKEVANIFKELSINNSNKSLLFDAFDSIHGNKVNGNTWFMPGNTTISARYDRIYYNQNCKALSFEIIGNETISWLNNKDSPYSTLSDHHGLLSTIEIINQIN